MNCETAQRLMESNDPGLAEHVLTCPSCMIGTHARYYEAPVGLERKIRESLRREGPAGPESWRWLAIAACLLLSISAAWNVAQLRSRVDPEQLVGALSAAVAG